MPRLELELTSTRDDGTWTWRAAGARKPKGTVDGALLSPGARVGDVVQAEVEIDLDGITVTSVLAPKEKRAEPERLEIIGTVRDEPAVTTQLVRKGGGDRRGRDRRDRGDRREGSRKDRDRRDRDRKDRPRNRRDETDRQRASGDRDGGRAPKRAAREPDLRPKPKRLRARRVNRDAVLADLPEEQRPVAEQVLRGGVPAVRKALDEQNQALVAEGKPPIKADSIVALAEDLLPRLREAEWRDRADAAVTGVSELDLRDLRSVVTAAETAARSAEARAQAEQLRTALTARVEEEHATWLRELGEALDGDRSVRALRMSSRPPKAGSPLPPETSARLVDCAQRSLTAETSSDRFALVLDALAYAPVHDQVTPTSIPAEPSEDLLAMVHKHAARLPKVAGAFGVGPSESTGSRTPPPPPPPPPPSSPPASEPAPLTTPG
jgi:hypothetical protein